MYMEGEAGSGLEGSGLYLLIAFGLLLLGSPISCFLSFPLAQVLKCKPFFINETKYDILDT